MRPPTSTATVALVTGKRVPSSTSRPSSTLVRAGPESGGGGGGGGGAGTNVCVNVIDTGTGLPPNVAGWNVNSFAAATTASS